jgi:hypothetical protein
MADDRRVMYHGFSYKGAHPTKWVWIAKNFLNLAFAGGHRVAKCSCKKYQNYRFLSQDDIQLHLYKVRFMSNYLVWHDHGEVQQS